MAAAFQQAVLDAELVLGPVQMLTEVSNALWRLRSWITWNSTVIFRTKYWHLRVIWITRWSIALIWLWLTEKLPSCSWLIKS